MSRRCQEIEIENEKHIAYESDCPIGLALKDDRTGGPEWAEKRETAIELLGKFFCEQAIGSQSRPPVPGDWPKNARPRSPGSQRAPLAIHIVGW
jgi:hypothetical protein